MGLGCGSGAGVGVEEPDYNVIKYWITMGLEGNQDRIRMRSGLNCEGKVTVEWNHD